MFWFMGSICICRYANELIRENIQIFNFLVVVFVVILPIPVITFWPLRDAIFNEEYPTNRMKGILCTLQHFDLSQQVNQTNLSDKPKLVVLAVGM